MNWQDAFLAQARSDYTIWKRLNAPDVPYAHRLHYLQMVTEKLSKGMFQCGPTGSAEPPHGHAAFVKMLRQIKSHPQARRTLGFTGHSAAFEAYIDSLLVLAAKIQELAPDLAGPHGPNPEYPWQDQATGEVIAPVVFDFREFDPRDSKMAKMESLIHSLLFL